MDFISQYGSIIPIDFLPQLNQKPQLITTNLLNEQEFELPQLFDWIPEDYVKTVEDYLYAVENIESLPLDKVPEKLKKGSGSLKIGSVDLSGAIIGGHKESSLNSEDAAKKK